MLLIEIIATEVLTPILAASVAPPGHPLIMVAFDQGGVAVGRGQWIGAAAFSSDGVRGAVTVQRTWRVSDDQAEVLPVPADVYARELARMVNERLNAVAARRGPAGLATSAWTVRSSLRSIAPVTRVTLTSSVAPDGSVVTVRTEPSPAAPGDRVVTTTRTPPAGSRERQTTSVVTVPGDAPGAGPAAGEAPRRAPEPDTDWEWIALGALVVGGAWLYGYRRKTRRGS